MEINVAEIMEWIKDVLPSIFRILKGSAKNKTPKKTDNTLERSKQETVVELNLKDWLFRYKRRTESEYARLSKNREEEYSSNEADKPRQTNKGDNNNAGLDDSGNDS